MVNNKELGFFLSLNELCLKNKNKKQRETLF